MRAPAPGRSSGGGKEPSLLIGDLKESELQHNYIGDAAVFILSSAMTENGPLPHLLRFLCSHLVLLLPCYAGPAYASVR